MTNQHGCVAEINGVGVLITGVAGSGKTSLMLALLEHAKQINIPANFICDDQTLLKVDESCIIAHAPQTIAGCIELRGYGIIHMQNQDSTKLSLLVEMIEDEKIERLPQRQERQIKGIALPLIQVPIRHETKARRIVFAWINAHTSNE